MLRICTTPDDQSNRRAAPALAKSESACRPVRLSAQLGPWLTECLPAGMWRLVDGRLVHNFKDGRNEVLWLLQLKMWAGVLHGPNRSTRGLGGSFRVQFSAKLILGIAHLLRLILSPRKQLVRRDDNSCAVGDDRERRRPRENVHFLAPSRRDVNLPLPIAWRRSNATHGTCRCGGEAAHAGRPLSARSAAYVASALRRCVGRLLKIAAAPFNSLLANDASRQEQQRLGQRKHGRHSDAGASHRSTCVNPSARRKLIEST